MRLYTQLLNDLVANFGTKFDVTLDDYDESPAKTIIYIREKRPDDDEVHHLPRLPILIVDDTEPSVSIHSIGDQVDTWVIESIDAELINRIADNAIIEYHQGRRFKLYT